MAENQQHAAARPDAADLPPSHAREGGVGWENAEEESLKDTEELLDGGNVRTQEADSYAKAFPAPSGCRRRKRRRHRRSTTASASFNGFRGKRDKRSKRSEV